MSRAGSVCLSLLVAMAQSAPAASSPGDPALLTVPGPVFKIPDPGRMRTESWVFNLVVADARGRNDIRPVRAELEIFSGTTLRESLSLPESTLVRKRATSYRITPDTDTLALQRRLSLDEVFDLRFAFLARPQGFGSDRVRVTLMLAVPGSANVVRSLDVPLRSFSQKTALIFPMRGPAVVSQSPFNNSGHAGHSNQFALDVLGLNEEYGPMIKGGQGNEEYAGWGREVVAPGAGEVVYARNDVRDNPPETNPEATYGSLASPVLAVAGNCVVIDHGNGEFSALMHMQHGSVTAIVGSDVRQGQVVGRVGNSGDAFGPHLHYQLQDGPELLKANSLPARFDNLPNADLSRGAYFRPR